MIKSYEIKIEFDGTNKENWEFVNKLVGLKGMRGVKNMDVGEKLVSRD